jgi:hypothetical protein
MTKSDVIDPVAVQKENLKDLWAVAYSDPNERIDQSREIAKRSRDMWDMLEFIAAYIDYKQAVELGKCLAFQFPHDPIAWLEIRQMLEEYHTQ